MLYVLILTGVFVVASYWCDLWQPNFHTKIKCGIRKVSLQMFRKCNIYSLFFFVVYLFLVSRKMRMALNPCSVGMLTTQSNRTVTRVFCAWGKLLNCGHPLPRTKKWKILKIFVLIVFIVRLKWVPHLPHPCYGSTEQPKTFQPFHKFVELGSDVHNWYIFSQVMAVNKVDFLTPHPSLHLQQKNKAR